MSASLGSIKYAYSNESGQTKISPSTKRRLDSLGIDPTLVTSESQAMSLISLRKSEKSFHSFTEQEKIHSRDDIKTSDTGLYSAMSLQAHNTRYLLGL